QRQIELIEDGGRVVQETRLYDSDKDETRSMRSKEVANDYRYFPEPDLLPVIIDDEYIAAVRATLPELPAARCARFVSEYALSTYDADVLTSDRAMADYFEAVVTLCGDAKLSANWVTADLLGLLNKSDLSISESPIKPEQLGTMISRIKDNTISGKLAKTVFEALAEGETDVDQIIESRGLKQVTDSGAIEKLVDDVIAANPDQVAQYRAGKDAVFGFFVGQAMKISKGKANPAQLNELLRNKLKAD
ncbi:MAG: Asp-tRNA(Asn)/Glu-tRNA(Gln) amidotransferase GatCAB subunit B, partial [Pseudohongiella sp.]|nr:Asp-tRNA(Asn)/Glu-tRNA(Gln) amidotransferase GatCAB subunit B [Pseudohongiella sp.]